MPLGQPLQRRLDRVNRLSLVLDAQALHVASPVFGDPIDALLSSLLELALELTVIELDVPW